MDFVIALVVVLALAAIAGVAILAVSNAKLWIELEAMKRSTHTLTYIDPLAQSFSKPPSKDESAKMDESNLGNIGME